jgi:hypothetical protein
MPVALAHLVLLLSDTQPYQQQPAPVQAVQKLLVATILFTHLLVPAHFILLLLTPVLYRLLL